MKEIKMGKRMLYAMLGLIAGLGLGMVVTQFVMGKFLSPILFPFGLGGSFLAIAMAKKS
jgi:hypothetical protein